MNKKRTLEAKIENCCRTLAASNGEKLWLKIITKGKGVDPSIAKTI